VSVRLQLLGWPRPIRQKNKWPGTMCRRDIKRLVEPALSKGRTWGSLPLCMIESLNAEFWNNRYESGQTPWDFGGVPAALQEFLKRHPKGGRVLIPGCGSGYEVEAFARAGYDVIAIDLSPVAVSRARQRVGPALGGRIFEGDFFKANLDPASFDVVYERSFLCALRPELRESYRDRMARVLKPGGALVGFFYYQKTDPEDGPPFGLAWGESDQLLARHFLLVKDVPCTDSLPAFAGRERWQENRRTAYPVKE